MWCVYILKCKDDTFYTGITTDINRRLEEHNSSTKGSKYTRTRRPAILVYSKKYTDRSSASQEEWRIKQLSRQEKEKMTINKINLY